MLEDDSATRNSDEVMYLNSKNNIVHLFPLSCQNVHIPSTWVKSNYWFTKYDVADWTDMKQILTKICFSQWSNEAKVNLILTLFIGRRWCYFIVDLNIMTLHASDQALGYMWSYHFYNMTLSAE